MLYRSHCWQDSTPLRFGIKCYGHCWRSSVRILVAANRLHMAGVGRNLPSVFQKLTYPPLTGRSALEWLNDCVGSFCLACFALFSTWSLHLVPGLMVTIPQEKSDTQLIVRPLRMCARAHYSTEAANIQGDQFLPTRPKRQLLFKLAGLTEDGPTSSGALPQGS